VRAGLLWQVVFTGKHKTGNRFVRAPTPGWAVIPPGCGHGYCARPKSTGTQPRGVAAVSTATTVVGGALRNGAVVEVGVGAVEVVQPVKITATIMITTAPSLRPVGITPDATSTEWSARPCHSRPTRWRRRRACRAQARLP